MSGQKKVTFGSKSSMVETWIIEESVHTNKRRGDVREICDVFCDDTMTSSSDAMVASNKTTNNKQANRHVTIGDSTVVIVTPNQTPDTPDSEGRRVLGHVTTTTVITGPGSHSLSMASPSVYHQHCARGGTPNRITKSPAVRTPAKQLSPRIHQSRPKREEYYDILRPEPKDQT